MLDFIYQMTCKLLKIAFLRENVKILPFFCFRALIRDVIALRYQICKLLGIYRFYWMALYHFQARRHAIKAVHAHSKMNVSKCA